MNAIHRHRHAHPHHHTSPLHTCTHRVTSLLHLLDPTTLNRAEIPASKYWRQPLEPVMSSKDLVQFEVRFVCVGGWVGWLWKCGSGGGWEDGCVVDDLDVRLCVAVCSLPAIQPPR
jgi:hypothetical protein